MSAHEQGIANSFRKQAPVDVPLSQIASTGYPLKAYADVEKVQRMQRTMQKGGKVKAVRVTRLTPANREIYGVQDKTKKFFLNTGHHRYAACKLEGKRTIPALPYEGRKI